MLHDDGVICDDIVGITCGLENEGFFASILELLIYEVVSFDV